MFDYLWLPCMVTVAAIALSAILFKEFLKKKRAGQIAVEGRADSDSGPRNGTVEEAARTSTSPPVSETATSSGHDYEVFLSFRGPDTRAGFTDFLYTSLIDAGIRAFKDDEDLRIGEEFASELLQAINQSKISIPIFSKAYASSVWCLKELVQMVECRKTRGQKIMPIFYDVAPSEVRHQIGGYGEAFRSHVNKKRYDEETLREWKTVLEEVSFLNGWDLHSMPNRREGEVVRKLTQKVFNELKKANLVVSDCLVSVDNHVDAIMEMIGAQTGETRIIGIHGMGGIGKTTTAKIIYNQLLDNFEGCCFLSNIREMSERKGIECLQNQLISDILKNKCVDIRNIDDGIKIIKDRLSNKRVILFLDDVHERNHMNALAGERNWFGKGSKLIITTRNKEVLDVLEVDNRYELTGMDRNQALQLFSKHAFRRDSPLDEYINQSDRAIHIAGGLPLALEVIGSLLSHTEKKRWDLTLKKLESVPHTEVQSKLKISYDTLNFRQKHVFLDIACLFIGYDKDILIHFWDESNFFPEDTLEVLQNMSLIKITEHNGVWMHDQLKDLGREMVRQESNAKIEKQSRVWDPKEGLDLLRRYKGKKEVEALRLKFDHQQQYRFTYEDAMTLSNLRFLEVDGSRDNFCERIPLNDSKENSDLLPQLRWLSWRKILPTIKITNFSMEDVVILDLSEGEITHDWKGWSHMEEMRNLKVLNLTHCRCLERTPNFSANVNLYRLILRGCSKLVEIDGSICELKRLVSLDVRDCENLHRLPEELGGLEALEELRIDRTSIKKIPSFQGMRNLRIFTASSCREIEFPPTMGDLASLEYLSLRSCKSLESLPDSIGNLKSLIELDIQETGIRELPDSIGNLKNLKVVKMTSYPTSKIPDSFWTIEMLEEIEVWDVWSRWGFHVKIGSCIYKNQSLRILNLHGAKMDAVPMLPESLVILDLGELNMKTFPDLSNLTNLKSLALSFDGEFDGPVVDDPMPRWIGNLSKLETLNLTSVYVTTLPTDISSLLPQLKRLSIRCHNLRCLPRLPSSLLSLTCHYCKSFCSMDLSNLKKLSYLQIWFSAVSVIRGLDRLENLEQLDLRDLQQVGILPDLSNLNMLRSLKVMACDNLVEIQGKLPQSLAIVYIRYCESLQKFPDLSRLKELHKVKINGCGKLDVKAISSLCSRKFDKCKCESRSESL